MSDKSHNTILILIGIIGLILFIFGCIRRCEASPPVQWWDCEAKPPVGTKNRDWRLTSSTRRTHENAMRSAISFCNATFNTDKCAIDVCEFNSRVPATAEWRCESVPPKGTKFRLKMKVFAIHSDRKVAEESAIRFCNALFKTKNCEIRECKFSCDDCHKKDKK